jgi:Fe-S cluster assembly scaffold protein SufB
MATPIHLICINTSAPAAAAATTSNSGSDADAQRCCSAPRLLVALAEGSEVEVVEEVVSVGTSSNHTSFAVTEAHLAEGASLKYGYVQREAAGAQQFKSTLVSQVGAAAWAAQTAPAPGVQIVAEQQSASGSPSISGTKAMSHSAPSHMHNQLMIVAHQQCSSTQAAINPNRRMLCT